MRRRCRKRKSYWEGQNWEARSGWMQDMIDASHFGVWA